MDGASSLADLIHDVLDLIGEGLVLTSDLVKLEDGLLVGRLGTEQFRGGVASLLLSIVKIHANAVNLLLPFSNNSVELLGLLLHGAVEDLGLVQLLGHGLQLRLDLGLVLVGSGLSLGQTGLHLQLGHFQLLSLGNTLLLVSQLHHLSLGIGLGHLSDAVLLGRHLLVIVISHASNIVFGISVFAQQRLSLLGLVVSHSTGLGQLVSEADLELGQHVGRVLQLLELTEKVGILSSKLSLVSLKISQCKVGLFDLLGKIIESSLEVLQAFLCRSLATVDLISGSTSISNLVHDDSLVLLNLGLDLVQLLDLLLHLGNGILVLLLKSNNGGLLLDLGLLKVSPQLGHLSLSLLVQFNLGTGGSGGLIETLTEVLQLTSKVRSLALSLGSPLSLSLKFLLHLLNSCLDLLDGLLDLGNQGLFILQLAHQTRGILLLASNGILKFLSGSLKFRNSFLHNLQFSLNLPSFLLNVGSATLLLLIRALQLIKS